jgi:hypothetical protein
MKAAHILTIPGTRIHSDAQPDGFNKIARSSRLPPVRIASKGTIPVPEDIRAYLFDEEIEDKPSILKRFFRAIREFLTG